MRMGQLESLSCRIIIEGSKIVKVAMMADRLRVDDEADFIGVVRM